MDAVLDLEKVRSVYMTLGRGTEMALRGTITADNKELQGSR